METDNRGIGNSGQPKYDSAFDRLNPSYSAVSLYLSEKKDNNASDMKSWLNNTEQKAHK
jgi:hypothetical protein